MLPALSFGNSRASSTLSGDLRVETGMVVNVNPVNKTVDWAAQYTGRVVVGLQVSSPYLHPYNGEGQTTVPDLGALCAVCWPSDGEAPFIMGFLMPPEPMLTSGSGDPQAADQPTMGGYNGGRPILNPGDQYFQGRDGNFLVLRKGGVLQVGSSDICQRIFIPLNNLVRDVCENWELNTIGGSMTWRASMSDSGPDSSHQGVQFDLIAREEAQDKLASVRVSVGKVKQSNTQLEIVIAKEGIDPVSGEVSASKPAFVMRVSDDGTGQTKYGSNLTEEVGGDHKTTVAKNRMLDVTLDYQVTVRGSFSTSVEGEHKISGDKGSTETWAGTKVVAASAIRLGAAGASHPVPMGDILIQWLMTHTHPGLSPLAYPVPPPPPNILSRKVTISE